MSGIFSTVSNFGGRQPDNSQNIKQYVTTIGCGAAAWIFKSVKYTFDNVTTTKTVLTPSDSSKPVLIDNDLIVVKNFYNLSDSGYKTDVLPIYKKRDKIAFDRFLRLEPVTYNHMLTGNDTIGFIAQDVQKLYPELVTDIGNGTLGVNYLGVIPLCVVASKAMAERIDELEARIATLEKKYTV